MTANILKIIIVGLVLKMLMLQKTDSFYMNRIESDYVPNEETAIKIAEAIWLPIYGEKVLSEKPYYAVLKNDSIWVVKGSLKKGFKGGVPYIEIQKNDCKILKVTHGK